MKPEIHFHERVKKQSQSYYTLDNKYEIRAYYNHGYVFQIHEITGDRNLHLFTYSLEGQAKGIDFRKVFSLKNIIKYYLWSIRQKLWWKHEKIRKLYNPNKHKPYPL